MEKQIHISRLNSKDVSNINDSINLLNKKYFKKKLWPLNISGLMLNGSALIDGEIKVLHFKPIWEKTMDDPFSSNPKNAWNEISKKEKIDFSFKISKISNLLSNKYVADVEVMFTIKDEMNHQGVYLGSTAGKKISDIFHNLNELIEHKENPKFCTSTLKALNKYT